MDNQVLKDFLSKLSQRANALIAKMVLEASWIPTQDQMAELEVILGGGFEVHSRLLREQALIRGGADVCKYCGCTPTNACVLYDGVRDRNTVCSWMDRKHTVCSNPECVAKSNAEKSEANS